MILINHASGNPRKEIYVISAELSKMRDTVLKDCISILQEFGLKCTVTGHISGQPRVDFPNGSFIRFLGLDKDDIGKGLRSDVVFFNECNKMNFEGYREASARARNVYMDFNPNANFWAHEEVIPRKDAEFIKLTFKDNEHIPQTEYDEIMFYYEKGYDAEGNVINKYWANKWRVYGLGEVGILEGAVHEDWEIIEDLPRDEKGEIQAELLGCGVDWGYINPAAWIAVYRYDGKFIFDQIVYESKLSNQDLAEMVDAEGMADEIAYADSAEPKSIAEVRGYGINIHPCDNKVDLVNYGIKILNQDTFYVTARSTELIEEFRCYEWEVSKQRDRDWETLLSTQ